MVRIYPGDLISISADGRYFYAIVLDRILYFGGNWCFVLHRATDQLATAVDILDGPVDGFHAFVDFIWAKRENRITRLARKIDIQRFQGCGFLKDTHGRLSTCPRWCIYDMQNRELRVQQTLTTEEERYPLHETIDDSLMVDRVLVRWRPELDEDIKIVADYAAEAARLSQRRCTIE